MPRKTGNTVVNGLPQVATEIVAADTADLAQAVAIERAAQHRELEIGETLMTIGGVRALHAMTLVTQRAAIELFDRAVSSGKHLGLAYRKPDGSVARTESVEEFCSVFLGRSYGTLKEQRQNLRLAGPQLYDQLEATGLQRSDWRALRNLEQADDAALQQALAAPEEQKLDRVLVLLESVKAQQEQATAQIADLKADLAAKEKLGEMRNRKIDELSTALERRAAAPQVEQENALIAEIDAAVDSACAAATPLIGKLIAAQEARWSERVNAACRHGIERCLTFYLDLARENGVGIDLDAMLDGTLDRGRPPTEPTLTAVK